MAKKRAKQKGYRRQAAKKAYLSKRDIAILCLIVAAVAVAAFFLFRYDDGALKVQDGAVVADGDNWLIANGSNVRGGARYYKLGEIGEIDGCTREKGALSSDANIPEYAFTPAGEDGGDVRVTVTCGHGGAEAMSKYTHSLLEGSETVATGELQTAQMAGREVRWYSYDADLTADNAAAADAIEEAARATGGSSAAETGRYSRAIAAYIDASRDCSVILQANSHGDTQDDCLDDEALLGLLKKAVEVVTVEGK